MGQVWGVNTGRGLFILEIAWSVAEPHGRSQNRMVANRMVANRMVAKPHGRTEAGDIKRREKRYKDREAIAAAAPGMDPPCMFQPLFKAPRSFLNMLQIMLAIGEIH